ncbi:response regulator [Mucilaginibacter robiniae]|uniref:Response regulator n=1 Tax=Mucilaginibacter robiniae TaxID=2728022 RepID=A0A7L5E2X1_9SPHI|nr:response regulator [Mucilaginibacter robiniae]QJD96689.1 response regulator [Mucilaginibacter robiniae]
MRKILILDDDADILDVMQEALQYEGFEVAVASGTDNIFSLLNKHQPDLLMVDYILNGINGGELCHQVKADQHTRQLPVIIVSAYPKVFKSLGYYGCNAFMPKPFDLDELTSTITNLINTSSYSITI